MKIIYSYNKIGYEDIFWRSEIDAASSEGVKFISFNHGEFLDPSLYTRAQLLDNLWYQKNRSLLRMYQTLEELIVESEADALIVDNCFPYHPEFLKGLPIYKVMRTSDGPVTAYDRDFAYLHAYDHVFCHSNAYSRDISMIDKLAYCGATNVDFLPLGLFSASYDTFISEELLFSLAWVSGGEEKFIFQSNIRVSRMGKSLELG